MKHFYTLIILALFSISGIRAQNPIVVSEDEFDIGNGTVTGYSVVIPEVNYDKVLKDWIRYLETGTRSKVVEKGNNLSIFGAKVKPLSEDPVNVYSMVKEDNGGVKIQTAFELEREQYAGSAEYANGRKYLFDFAKDEYMEVVSEQLSAEEKKLRSLKNDLTGLENDQARMEKSTKTSQETIEEENQNLADYKNQLASLTPEEYHGDSAAVTGMGSRSADDVKDLEKERKKLNREINSSEEKIDRAEKEIAQNERDLPGNLNEQKVLKNKVEEQEKVVEFHQKKLDTIKDYK